VLRRSQRTTAARARFPLPRPLLQTHGSSALARAVGEQLLEALRARGQDQGQGHSRVHDQGRLSAPAVRTGLVLASRASLRWWYLLLQRCPLGEGRGTWGNSKKPNEREIIERKSNFRQQKAENWRHFRTQRDPLALNLVLLL